MMPPPPPSKAFAKIPGPLLKFLLQPANIKSLVNVLDLHVVQGTLSAADLLKMNGATLKSINNLDLVVTITDGEVYVESGLTKASKVIAADNVAENGVAHIVDTVLIPATSPPKPPVVPDCNPTECTVCAECCKAYITGQDNCFACVEMKCQGGIGTIVTLAVDTPDLSTLVTALKAGDLVDTLSAPGPFTVFAPTNEAFNALPSGAVASLLKPQNKPQLVDVLTYHVVAGTVYAKDLKDGETLTTVEGKTLTVRVTNSGTVLVNSAVVTTADVLASNGVVHIIDGVLMP